MILVLDAPELVSELQSVFQVVGVLLIFAFVLFITWFTTRLLAGWQKTETRNRNLQVVETIRIAQNKYVQIVRAGQRYLVLGIGKDEVTLLSALSREEVEGTEDQRNEGQTIPFQAVLQKVRGRFPKGGASK